MELPPSLSPASANVGPAVAPQGNQGNAAAAMMKVRNAVKALEEALPLIPMGSPLHAEILNSAKGLGKHLTQGDGNQALELQALVQQMRSASQASPVAALSRLFPGGGAATPPAMSQPAPTGAPVQ